MVNNVEFEIVFVGRLNKLLRCNRIAHDFRHIDVYNEAR